MSHRGRSLGGLNIHQAASSTKPEGSENPSTEIWRSVLGYEGWYEVSDLGSVRRVKAGQRTCPGKVLRQPLNAAGYPVVSLSRESRQAVWEVHRLVAAAFLGDRPAGHEVDHIDGVRTNARRSNLEYVTHAENMRRSRETRARYPVSVSPHPKGRFRKGSTLDKVYRAARDVGMTRKQALEFVADSLASALVATKSPLARAVVEEEGRKTTALVMAIRERNARRAA